MRVLLSIKPEFVAKILDGSKKFEFRKQFFKKKGITTVVVYSTMPVGKVVAEFDIDGVVSGSPDEIWSETKYSAGITKDFFDQYYQGKHVGFAIKVGRVHQYETPLELADLGVNVQAPQSYRYLT